jgi:hypothetical protein
MDSFRNFQSIRIIIFVNNLHSIHLKGNPKVSFRELNNTFERGAKSFIPRNLNTSSRSAQDRTLHFIVNVFATAEKYAIVDTDTGDGKSWIYNICYGM